MKPTPDDVRPRRDGWFEHAATWGEVTVGTILADPAGGRTLVYEVIEARQGDPIEHNATLWHLVREVNSGEQFPIPPRFKDSPVVILTDSPATEEPMPYVLPADAEAVRLLVAELGATHLAAYDAATGETTCPNYDAGHVHEGGVRRDSAALLEHMRFAHGIDTTELEALEGHDRTVAVTTLHGRAHDQRFRADINRGGFPHRHVPEHHPIFNLK